MTDLEFIHRPITIKTPPDFKVVSTFAGCGGSSTGYVWAGGKVVLAVEWDNNAVETYKLNYPDTTIYHGDIAKLSVEEALSLAGVKPYELDIFDGSPPCQGFSTAGKRKLDDPRNQLFREYVRLLKGFMPKVFVMENVSGMVKGKMKLLFAEILKELKSCGYRVSAKLLNAMYLGVPQSRQRMIFIGVRDDLGIEPSHPKPQTRPIASKIISESRIDGLYGKFLLLEGKTSELIKQLRPDERMMDLNERLTGKKAYFAFSRLHPEKPSRTITKDSAGIIHYAENRTVSIGEMQTIASFPNLYHWVGSFSDVNQRIGNSVPPEMMRRIALHIKEHILLPAKVEHSEVKQS